jgi:FkbM family methyltransferase
MFYSQDKQDEIIETQIFKGFKNGVFIDVGAYDGLKINNTYYFEKENNWKGINIEPSEHIYKELLVNRPNCININVAIDNKDDEDLFLLNTGYTDMISGLKKYYNSRYYLRLIHENCNYEGKTEIIKIKTRKLSTIIDEHKIKNINYLSIDAMGAELEILKSIDYEKTFIDVISFQNNFYDDSKKVIEFLENKDFEIFNDKILDIIMINKKSNFYPNKLSNSFILNPKKPKIIVCTMAVNDWYYEIVKYAINNMKIYCNKHDYEFLIDDGTKFDTVYDGKRDCPWYKILFIKKIMLEKDFDYLFWVDADSQILMHERKLEYYIDKYFPKDKDILITDDRTTMNTGVIFFRKSNFNIELMDRIWNNENDFDKNFHEQTSLEEIYKRDKNVRDKIEIMKFGGPREDIVVYWGGYFPGKTFLIHCARCSHDKLGFMYMMDVYYPFKLDEENIEEYKQRMNWLNNEEVCRADLEKSLRKEYVKIEYSARVKKFFNLK